VHIVTGAVTSIPAHIVKSVNRVGTGHPTTSSWRQIASSEAVLSSDEKDLGSP